VGKIVKLVADNAIFKNRFIEVGPDNVYCKLKFDGCCVDSEYSTRFLNCSLVDLGISVRVKKQELRKCKRSWHLIIVTAIIIVWLKTECSDKKWKNCL
jgi:hypothetical protein